MAKTVKRSALITHNLNAQQQKAVTTTKGPVLILAGAGSGKTRTLVHRIAYLIAEERVHPQRILAVTFTKKAAENMRLRMVSLVGDLPAFPAMGTFHSICSRILRADIEALGHSRNFVIYDDHDQQLVVKTLMKEQGYDTKHISPTAVHWRISSCKQLLLPPNEYTDKQNDSLSEVAAIIYPLYQEELKKRRALDFDDLIMKTVELFQQHESVLQKYQNLWQYILVDEYQDTNQAQYQLVHLLSQAHQNVCVVGDDAQSIYSWRMADIRNILNFEQDYPEATTILLEENYRSTQTILNASNAVIEKNTKQKRKKLWTKNSVGEPVYVSEVENEQAEGRYIIERILGLALTTDEEEEGITYDTTDAQIDPEENLTPIQRGESILDRVMGARTFTQQKKDDELRREVERKRREINFAEYVVLYRTNAQSRAIEESLISFGVPYQIIGGIRFYERKEIKDALAYLRALVNPHDWISLERIVNLPPRGIGDRTWFTIEQFARQRGFDVFEAAQHVVPGVQQARLQNFYAFAHMLEALRSELPKRNPQELLEFVMSASGYKDWVLKESKSPEEGESRWENIQELKTAMRHYEHLQGEEGVHAFLEHITLVSDQDHLKEKDNVVKLMTIHAAKGLEFPEVFVVGMEEGLFPHSRSLIQPEEMEEERRLCYVALTRAGKRIHLLFASQRMRYGNVQVNPPSRFIEDIPPELRKWVK